MSKFTIEFEPALVFPSLVRAPRRIEGHEFHRLYKAVQEKYLIRYLVGGELFVYYPEPLVIILEDLQQEVIEVSAGRSHVMTLSGYPILEMLISDNEATFAELGAGELAKRIISAFPLSEVEREIRTANDQVWSAIVAQDT